ncbi:MAG: thioredoxin domain-containing protein [Sphingopyxis sp.]|uniref:DsbA family protein n=1 Tax=Sphingopyxis sp. TaxID=1908224 RepID=UPI002ABAAC32|nr:thioredoxin domain-containing protein [Sphingopyxis sp.]MDZ3830622.1 thioredoxin domain-containing protein [Sphingopyxis sp.]
MTDKKDDYYQPWLRDPTPPAPPRAPGPGGGHHAGADQGFGAGFDGGSEGGLAKPKDSPPVGMDLSRYPARDERPREPLVKAEQVKAGATRVAQALRDGAEAFADWTIRVGERADIPARVEAMEIPRRSRIAAERSAMMAGAAARAMASGAARASRTAADAGGRAWQKMALGDRVTRLSNEAGRGLGHAADKTRAGLEQAARDARDGLGEAATRLRPAPREEAPPPPSGLEQLLAREAAEAREAEIASAPDLPLFASEPPATISAAAPQHPSAEGAVPPTAGATSKPAGGKGGSAKAMTAQRLPRIEGARMDSVSPRMWMWGGGALLALALVFWLGGRLGGGLSKSEVETVVADYIKANPEIIPAALEAQRDREMARAIDSIRPALEKPYAGAWAGNADGDVTLVVFTDYACGFCRASVPDVDRLIREDKRLKVVFRELPIIAPQSRDAALMALAAARQGKYDAFHHAMFQAGSLDKSAIAAAAERAGVVTDGTADATANEAIFQRELDSNLAIATQLQLNATPTWVIGNQLLQGQVGYDTLRQAVAKARAKS